MAKENQPTVYEKAINDYLVMKNDSPVIYTGNLKDLENRVGTEVAIASSDFNKNGDAEKHYEYLQKAVQSEDIGKLVALGNKLSKHNLRNVPARLEGYFTDELADLINSTPEPSLPILTNNLFDENYNGKNPEIYEKHRKVIDLLIFNDENAKEKDKKKAFKKVNEDAENAYEGESYDDPETEKVRKFVDKLFGRHLEAYLENADSMVKGFNSELANNRDYLIEIADPKKIKEIYGAIFDAQIKEAMNKNS